MHPIETKNEFLRLRVQGLSFARISAQLGVSKPTLIAWSRQRQAEIHALRSEQAQGLNAALEASHEQRLTRLTTHLKFLQHELLSRSLEAVPTGQLESLASWLQGEIQNLQSVGETSLLPVKSAPGKSN